MKPSGNNCRSRLIIPVLASLLLPSAAFSQPSGCDGCSRTAILANTLLNDPMKLVSSDAFRPSVFSRIAELATTPCFHLSGSEADSYSESLRAVGSVAGYGSERRIAEYSFESELVSGLNETGPDGRPVRSKWTISLWFEGSQRELVHSWQTMGTQEKRPSSPNERNTGTTFFGHGNMMSTQFNDGQSITEIIERFEKRPVECTITPEYEWLGAGEVMEIKITDFRDLYGQNSREFNRIIVHADNGEITNGDECDVGPGYKVFEVRKEGIVRARYRAPADGSENSDIIKVYNTCDVLPKYKVPYSKTGIDDKIAEKRIEVNSYDAVLTITATTHKDRQTSSAGSNQTEAGKDCRNSFSSRKEFLEELNVTVRIMLNGNTIMRQSPVVMVNQTAIGFTPVRADITAFSYNLRESSFSRQETTGSDCRNGGSEGSRFRTRSVTGTPSVRLVPVPNSIAVSLDPKTGKALKIGFHDVGIEFMYNEAEESRSRSWPSDSPPSSSSKSEEKRTIISVSPVGDPVPDPYPLEINYNPVLDSLAAMKKKLKGTMGEQILSMLPDAEENMQNEKSTEKIRPDLLVTKGDGKTSFGGEGKKSTEKKLDGGNEREDLTFSWNLILRNK